MLRDILAWIGNPSTLVGAFMAPVVRAGIDVYKARLTHENSQEQIAAAFLEREQDIQKRELELRSAERLALIGHWYEPANLLGYVLVLYIGKVVLWDSMLGLGETPAIKGAVGDWLGMIATFFVGTRGAVSVASIFRRR